MHVPAETDPKLNTMSVLASYSQITIGFPVPQSMPISLCEAVTSL